MDMIHAFKSSSHLILSVRVYRLSGHDFQVFGSLVERISEFSQQHANCVVLLVNKEQSDAVAKYASRLQVAFVAKASMQIHAAFKDTLSAAEFLVKYVSSPSLPKPLSKADETTLLVKKACHNILNVYVNQN